MKIACISASQVPSSTANSIQVMKVCQSLAQLGHQVHLFVPGEVTTPWEQIASHYGLQPENEPLFAIEWLRSDPKLRRYDFSWAAVRRARSIKADMAYVWPPQAAALALIWRMPVAFELHGPPEGSFGPMVFRLILKLRGQKRFLPITRALVDLLERDYHRRFDPGEVVVAPNGVDLERYESLPSPSGARLALGLPDTLTAGYTGHLYPGRGMSLLVELARSFPQVHFVWVGGRPAEVEGWRLRLATEKVSNVSLLGFIENSRLPLYQAAADILLMPYERQIAGSSGGNSADYCSPMKMFEYMAAGRAIISSDLPVIREVLSPENAILCKPEDAGAWEQALRSLISDPEWMGSLGRRARQDVQAYSWQSRARRCLEGFCDQ